MRDRPEPRDPQDPASARFIFVETDKITTNVSARGGAVELRADAGNEVEDRELVPDRADPRHLESREVQPRGGRLLLLPVGGEAPSPRQARVCEGQGRRGALREQLPGGSGCAAVQQPAVLAAQGAQKHSVRGHMHT
eukprot:COSAG01_NODE_928_length_12680_cov_73.441380_8_plen_137_part_00